MVRPKRHDEARDAWAAKRGPVRMLFASRLIPEKGVFTLLSAIKAVAEVGTDVEFSIHPIGEGGLRGECVAAARDFELGELVDDLDVDARRDLCKSGM